MINQLKKEILNNKDSFPVRIEEKGSFKFLKFFHGDYTVNKKVIFLVSYKGSPLCIIKIVRDSRDNDLIEREIKGLSFFSESDKNKVPQVFFSGDIKGMQYVCEEYIESNVLSKKDEADLFKKVFEYHQNIPREAEIKISWILNLFKDFSTDDQEYNTVLSLLEERVDDIVFRSPQHGDLTYKNIFLNKEGDMVLIDLENFDLRNIWGTDLVHYMVRMCNIDVVNGNISDAMQRFIEKSSLYIKKYQAPLSCREIENLYLIDLFFDILQKNLRERKKEFIPLMQSI